MNLGLRGSDDLGGSGGITSFSLEGDLLRKGMKDGGKNKRSDGGSLSLVGEWMLELKWKVRSMRGIGGRGGV